MRKITKLIKNKDLINIFKKSKFKNYTNKKKKRVFAHIIIKFKKNIKNNFYIYKQQIRKYNHKNNNVHNLNLCSFFSLVKLSMFLL
jgi:hypothetical protein